MTFPLDSTCSGSLYGNLNQHIAKHSSLKPSNGREVLACIRRLIDTTGMCAGTRDELERFVRLIDCSSPLSESDDITYRQLIENAQKVAALDVIKYLKSTRRESLNLRDALVNRGPNLPHAANVVLPAIQLLELTKLQSPPYKAWVNLMRENFGEIRMNIPLDQYVFRRLETYYDKFATTASERIQKLNQSFQSVEDWNHQIDELLAKAKTPPEQHIQDVWETIEQHSKDWRTKLLCLQKVCSGCLVEETILNFLADQMSLWEGYEDPNANLAINEKWERGDIVGDVAKTAEDESQLKRLPQLKVLFDKIAYHFEKFYKTKLYKKINDDSENLSRNLLYDVQALLREIEELIKGKAIFEAIAPEDREIVGNSLKTKIKAVKTDLASATLDNGLLYVRDQLANVYDQNTYRFKTCQTPQEEALQIQDVLCTQLSTTGTLEHPDNTTIVWREHIAPSALPALTAIFKTFFSIWCDSASARTNFLLGEQRTMVHLKKALKALQVTRQIRSKLYDLAYEKLIHYPLPRSVSRRERLRYQKRLFFIIFDLTTLPATLHRKLPELSTQRKTERDRLAKQEPSKSPRKRVERKSKRADQTAVRPTKPPTENELKGRNIPETSQPRDALTESLEVKLDRDLEVTAAEDVEDLALEEQMVDWGDFEVPFIYDERVQRWFTATVPFDRAIFWDYYNTDKPGDLDYQRLMLRLHRLLPLVDFFCFRGEDFYEQRGYGKAVRNLILPTELIDLQTGTSQKGVIVWAIDAHGICFHRFFHHTLKKGWEKQAESLERAIAKINTEEEGIHRPAERVNLSFDNYTGERVMMHKYKDIATISSERYPDLIVKVTFAK